MRITAIFRSVLFCLHCTKKRDHFLTVHVTSFYQGFYAFVIMEAQNHSKVFCFLLIDQLEIESDGLKTSYA